MILRVPYDIEQAIQDAIDATLPDWKVYAEDLSAGRFTGPSTRQDPPRILS